MRAQLRHEWLQKHPTPRADDGDFHWYPGALDPALAASIAAGLEGDVTLWLAPGRVVCARKFTDVAPADGRRYTGIAALIASCPEATAAALLAAVRIPDATPWAPGAVHGTAPKGGAVHGTAPNRVDMEGGAVHGTAPNRVGIAEPGAMAGGEAGEALVAACWSGGAAAAVAIESVAAIETWLPAEVRGRARTIVSGGAAVEVTDVARWLARAIAARGAGLERARRAWTAVAALAAVEVRPVDAMFDELGAVERAWRDAAALRAYLARVGVPLDDPRLRVDGSGADQWARALHGYGRGWLTSARRDALVAVVVRRGVADLVASLERDARWWWRALRWDALLPADRAAELTDAAVARLPMLEEVADAA